MYTADMLDLSSRMLSPIPRVGDPAPEFATVDVSGQPVVLTHHPKPVVLVFLRHLA